MQLTTIYLYPNVVEAYTELASDYTQERFRMVYSRALKVYRATDNRIDLQVRKGDQKKINLTGSTIVFSLVSREDSELVLKKDVTADDATQGRFYVTLTETEMRDIEPGLYSYSFIKETRQDVFQDSAGLYKVTSSFPLYLDSQFGAEGTIEVNGDVYGEPYDTIEVVTFNKTVNFDKVTNSRDDDPAFDLPRPNYARHTPISGYEEFFESSQIDAQGNQQTPQSLHTFQVYANAYEGELKLQGSLDPGGVPIDENWTDIKTWNLTTSDENFYHNVTGKYNWFRFRHVPADNNTGTVDKILYR